MLSNFPWGSLCLIFFAAFVVRISYIAVFTSNEQLVMEDQYLYLSMAQVIREHGIWTSTTERVPGYPIFINLLYDLTGNNTIYIPLLQAAIDSVTCVIIGLLANKVIKQGCLLSGYASAVNLNMIVLSGMVLNDSLFLFFFTSALLLFVYCIYDNKATTYPLCVGMLSFATMIRPTTYYLVPFALVAMAGWGVYIGASLRKATIRFVVGVFVCASILSPQLMRNWQQYGATEFVSQSGSHLLGWVVPATYQYSGRGPYQAGQELASSRLDAQMTSDGLLKLPNNPFDESRYKAAVAKEILGEFGVISIAKAWAAGAGINMLAPSVSFAPAVRAMDHPSFYGTPGAGVLEKILNYVNETSGLLYLAILGFGTLTQGVFVAAFLFGWWRLCRDAWSARELDANAAILLFLTVMVVYFLAITGPIIGPKYRLPLEPIMTVFAVAGYFRLRQSASPRII